MTPRVVIVGGGIAGLAAAYELSRQQVPFVLLESGPRAGGVILSEQVGGFTVDAGPDSLLVQKPDAIKLCEELGLAGRLIPTSPPRLAFIQRGGRLCPLPASSVLGIPTRIGPFVRTPLFSWGGKLRMGAELAVPARRDAADESIGAFMTRRFGAEATTYLAEPLLAGIHAGDVDALSLKALFPRLAQAEQQHGSLLRAFSRERPPASKDGAFRSLPGGLGEMVSALERALPAGAVRLNQPAVRVLPSRDGARVVLASGETVEAAAAVVATPAYVTAQLLQETDARLSALCSEIRYASTATIALAFSRAAVGHPLNGSGFVVPRVESSGLLAASWLSSKWGHRAPDGHVLMRGFVGGARDPHALDRSDAELVALTLASLRPLLQITGDPIFTRVYRWEQKSAQHNVGHLARVELVDRALAVHPRLFITGSGFRGVGIPDCVADARATARKVAECVRAVPSPVAS